MGKSQFSLWTGSDQVRSTFLISLIVLSACAGTTNVIKTDLTVQRGVYIVGFIERQDIRRELEDRIVNDLATYEMIGIPSYLDIKKIKSTPIAQLAAAANSHSVAAVLIVNRVSRDGSDSIISSDRKIAPVNPDLLQYYESTKDELDVYGRDEAVFAEVNAFFIDGKKTRRFWTGTTWSFNIDNEGGAIEGISATIAAELAKARDQIRTYTIPEFQ